VLEQHGVELGFSRQEFQKGFVGNLTMSIAGDSGQEE
jgi:hypothetical protein